MKLGNFKILIFTTFFILIFSKLSLALYVGVAPGHVDLGVVKRGEKIRLTFYILSDTKENLKIQLIYRDINPFIIGATPWSLEELSEESFENWINFIDGNPVEITSKKTFYPEIGLAVNKKYNAILTVPEDAEPGYHTATILLQPLVSSPTEPGARITIITTAELRITFRVEGKVERKVEVLGFLEKMEMPNTLLVTVFVRNKGNVTLLSKLTDFKVFDENGTVIASTPGTQSRIKAGKIGTLITRINTLNSPLEIGKRYNASAKVTHATEEITFYGTLLVPKYVEVIKVPAYPPPFLWWGVLIIALICILGYLIYRWIR